MANINSHPNAYTDAHAATVKNRNLNMLNYSGFISFQSF